MSKAITDNSRVSLAVINKNFDENVVHSLLIVWLTDLANWFNVGKNLTAEQIKQLAPMIYKRCYFMSLQDFKVFFYRAKTGHYGKVYDRLDGQIIIDWLDQFENERDVEFENLRDNEKKMTELMNRPENATNEYLNLLKSIVK